MAYPNWVYSMFAFIGFALPLIPLSWHLEAWNVGTCLYIFWTSLGCLNQFINSLIWTGNVINHAPVWCDISTKFIVGSAVGIPTASLCINRRLYLIATSNTVTVTKAEKRRAVMIDLFIGLGLPLLEMILHYIPQGHRFNIFEDVGCYPSTYMTPVAFALVFGWPIAIGIVSGIYCTLSIVALNKRRTQFNELLSSNNNLNSHRYFRLMALAGTEILLTVGLGSWGVYLDVKSGVHPWKGWEDTHFGFSRVDEVPAILWKYDHTTFVSLELTRWFIVMCAIIFFIFFGFADEAMKHYRTYMTVVAKRMGYSTASFSGTSSTSGSGSSPKWKIPGVSSTGNASLPVFVNKETFRKRDSLDSFTNMTASYNGDMKEKSFGVLSLTDVVPTLDYNPSPISSGSSDRSSVFSETPSYPASVGGEEDDIEVSSVRRVSRMEQTPTLRMPEPALTLSNAPKHGVDQSSAV